MASRRDLIHTYRAQLVSLSGELAHDGEYEAGRQALTAAEELDRLEDALQRAGILDRIVRIEHVGAREFEEAMRPAKDEILADLGRRMMRPGGGL